MRHRQIVIVTPHSKTKTIENQPISKLSGLWGGCTLYHYLQITNKKNEKINFKPGGFIGIYI